jgi:ribose transport system permease protein
VNKTSVSNIFKKHETVSVGLVLVIFIAMIFASPYFLTQLNLDSIQTSIAPYGIIAVGMMALLITGVFDLSVGSVMCLGGLVSAMCLGRGMGVALSLLIGIATGTLVGFINGFLVEIAGINALITTIGMMYIVRGICEVTLVGQALSGFTDFPDSFLVLGRSKFLGVYNMFWTMLAIMILLSLYLKFSANGRRLYYIGGNPVAARLMGIKSAKIRIITFMLSGTLAALAGILVTARSGTANRYTGTGAQLDIIIACIIGGGSLAGGQGSMVGALFGTTFMVLMSNSFNLFEVAPQWRSIAVGIILLLVIAVDGYISLSKQKKLGKI